MHEFPIVVIGAGSGGLGPVRQITEALPVNCTAAVAVVFHVGAQPSHLPEILSWHGKLPVRVGVTGMAIKPGHLFVAPADHHMLLSRGGIQLDRGTKVHDTRPAVDPLFVSAAMTFGPRVVGVVLSGLGRDGAAGLRTIHKHGGLALIQNPAEAAVPDMPAAARAENAPEILPLDRLARRVAQILPGRQGARGLTRPLPVRVRSGTVGRFRERHHDLIAGSAKRVGPRGSGLRGRIEFGHPAEQIGTRRP